MAEDNQVVDEPVVESSEIPTEDNLPEEPPQQLSDIDEIIATLPEEQAKIVKENVMRHSDYTKKTQTIAEQRKMIERMQMDNKQKIEFYDQFVNDENFRQQVADSMGFKAPKTDAGINKKVEELLGNMSPDEKQTIEYIVQQSIEKAISPVKEFMNEQKTYKQQSRQEAVTQILKDFADSHDDFQEVDQAMRDEAIALGVNFQTMPVSKMKKALNSLYNAVTADKMMTKGKTKAAKEMWERTKKAQQNAAKSNRKTSPDVVKTGKQFNTVEEAFGAVFQ